jgi:hypothetical protein
MNNDNTTSAEVQYVEATIAKHKREGNQYLASKAAEILVAIQSVEAARSDYSKAYRLYKDLINYNLER